MPQKHLLHCHPNQCSLCLHEQIHWWLHLESTACFGVKVEIWNIGAIPPRNGLEAWNNSAGHWQVITTKPESNCPTLTAKVTINSMFLRKVKTTLKIYMYTYP